MKKIFLYGLAALVMASCSEVGQDENLVQQNIQDELAYSDFGIDLLAIEKEMKILEQKNQTRLANATHLKKDCDSNINVPLDYPTIQEAVDNICDGGTIIVETGTYLENIYINKPGIKIIADGEVEVNGGFTLYENADETTIHNFKINLVLSSASNRAFSTLRAGKLTLTQNEIRNFYGSPRVYGVLLSLTNESTIHQNKIEGFGIGINLTGPDINNEELTHKNVISNNEITNYANRGIYLTGNTYENLIKNNTLESSGIYPSVGITLYAYNLSYANNYNQIKNNKSNNARIGFFSSSFNSGNDVSGNEFINHNEYGISVAENSTGEPNIFKNNIVQGSGICDIVYSPIGNVLINNDADCVTVL